MRPGGTLRFCGIYIRTQGGCVYYAYASRNIPLLVPLLIVDAVLVVAAVRHILRHPHYRFGNRVLWLVLSVAVLPFGHPLFVWEGEDQ